MNGRGVYIYNSDQKKHQTSLYYAGNFKQGIAQGHGKMVFKDGTVYKGSFLHNQMQCPSAVIEYGNGDRYEGPVEQGKKHGTGTYAYQNGDTYVGGFRGDKKHTVGHDGASTQGEMTFPSLQVTYKGDFQNDQKIGNCLIEFGEGGYYGRLQGELDANEEITGPDNVFEFPMQKMVYRGEFRANQMHG